MTDYLPFIIFLMILAIFLRAESALTVFYMIIGTLILGFWWNKRALRHIKIHRDYNDHAFLGDEVSVQININNLSILPILWLEIHESLPANLRAGRTVKHVFSMGSHGEKEIQYKLNALKRGYYTLGPLSVSSGDPLGLIQPAQNEFNDSPLTVYPQIVNLESFGLPSSSPFGTLKHTNPVFEDPSRLIGKRDFQYGDSVRKIDWKSTASSSKLQVKLYEASIDLDVAIMLDLHRESYDMKTFYDATELAITAAASIAAWGKTRKQTIGLTTNGIDPIQKEAIIHPLLPKKGNSHFINILEILARIQPGSDITIEVLIQEALADLSWGTTLVLISGGLTKSTLNQLHRARKRGLNPVILFTGHTRSLVELRSLAEQYHIPLHKAAFPHQLSTIGIK